MCALRFSPPFPLHFCVCCICAERQPPAPIRPMKADIIRIYSINGPTRLSPQSILALRNLAGVGDALGFLHDHDIIHADVKPANILLDENFSRFVLTDLGVAGGESYRSVDTCFRKKCGGWDGLHGVGASFRRSQNTIIDAKRGNVLGSIRQPPVTDASAVKARVGLWFGRKRVSCALSAAQGQRRVPEEIRFP